MIKDLSFFFDKPSKWQMEYQKLMSIIQQCGLTEELKWGKPCYTLNGNNVVLIHGFKEYCALLFHKGVLLKDAENILIQQTKNVQGPRQIRFSGLEEIEEYESIVKAYIIEAREIEKAGLQVEMKKTKDFAMVEEFKEKLNDMPELKNAFESLTPGRQRGYLLYFSQPKQSKTRISRIEKYIVHILEGKGLQDS